RTLALRDISRSMTKAYGLFSANNRALIVQYLFDRYQHRAAIETIRSNPSAASIMFCVSKCSCLFDPNSLAQAFVRPSTQGYEVSATRYQLRSARPNH